MDVKRLDIEDIPDILELRRVQELEKNYASNVVDQYLLAFRDWLGEHLNKDFFAIGIINEDSIIAMVGLMFFQHHDGKVFYLGAAFTKNEFRKKGLMSKLLETSFRFANNMDVKTIEAVIDSSTSDVTWHLTTEKYGATKKDNRYSLLLDKDFRFSSFEEIESSNNIYRVNDGKNNFVIVANLDHYISHPLNPSGRTVLLSLYSSDYVEEEKLSLILKGIINKYLNQGIYYFKVLGDSSSLQILPTLGFKKEKGYIRWDNIDNILENNENLNLR